MPQKKRTHSEKLIDDLKKLAKQCPALKQQVKALIDGIMSNESVINVNVNEKFKILVVKRQAAKYAQKSQAEFDEELKRYIEQQKKLFQRAQTLTDDDLAEIERIKAKAEKTRVAKQEESEIEEYLKDI